VAPPPPRYGMPQLRRLDTGWCMPDCVVAWPTVPSRPRACCYPPDVLADDGFALLQHLALTDYELGGYSWGVDDGAHVGRAGRRPGRAIVAGAGWGRQSSTTAGRGGAFPSHPYELGKRFNVARGNGWAERRFSRTLGGDHVADPACPRHVRGHAAKSLRASRIPTLVADGDDDHDTGSGEELAARASARHVRWFMPGKPT